MGRPRCPKTSDGFVGVVEIAKAIGVSTARMYVLRREGMFEGATKTLNNGLFVFHLEKSKELYKKHINLSKKHPLQKPPAETPIETLTEKPDKMCASMSMTEARAMKEQYLAKIKQIEFEEKVGKLLMEEDVKNGAFEMYRKTRDTLINIVDRISAQLAAEMNEADVRRILEGEIRMALAHIRETFDA